MIRVIPENTVSEGSEPPAFQSLNQGYNTVFRPNRLFTGLVAPRESCVTGPVPTMTRHIERIRLAEELGFCAIWLRDVPFNVTSFGDVGQIYDPFVYQGLLAGHVIAGTQNNYNGPKSLVCFRTSHQIIGYARYLLVLRANKHPCKYRQSMPRHCSTLSTEITDERRV